jgi:hypothetical protein
MLVNISKVSAGNVFLSFEFPWKHLVLLRGSAIQKRILQVSKFHASLSEFFPLTRQRFLYNVPSNSLPPAFSQIFLMKV